MTGHTPAVHLTRPATIRMLQNIQTFVPGMLLSVKMTQDAPKKSYAQAVQSNYKQYHARQCTDGEKRYYKYSTQQRTQIRFGTVEYLGIPRMSASTRSQSDASPAINRDTRAGTVKLLKPNR